MNQHSPVFRGRFGGGDPPTPTVAADNLVSTQYLRTVGVISEGPILGLVGDVDDDHGEKSIYLDDTPLMNPDGTLNFTPVLWGLQLGNPDQSWMQGINAVEAETSVNVQVLHSSGPTVRTLNNTDVDKITVSLRWPRLTFQDDQGNISGVRVQYGIDYKKPDDEDWTPFTGSPWVTVGKTTSGYDRQHTQQVSNISDSYNGPWMVRVTRITADRNSDTHYEDKLFWFSYTEITDAKLIYPDSAVMSMQAPAKAFNGAVAQQAFEIYGRIIRVPSNYDPETRAYDGLWDGSFQLAWTDNPAWCLFDMLTNTRYGLGLPDERVDSAALYTIGQYCDELVPNGLGGFEPRYTLNVAITRAQDAVDMINQLCTAFMGMPYYAAGGVMFSHEAPRDPDILVTRANVLNGEFEYQSSSYRETPNVVLANWVNPALGWDGDIVTVEDGPDIARRSNAVTRTYDTFGVITLGLATRHARHIMYDGLFGDEGIVYQAGLDHAEVVPGWVIAAFDPLRDGVVSAGRIIGTGGSIVGLDRPIEFFNGKSYALWLVNSIYDSLTITDYTTWTASGLSVTANAGTAPDGTETAWLLKEDTSTSSHYLEQVVEKEAELLEYRLEVRLKSSGRGAQVGLRSDSGEYAGISVNLLTGALMPAEAMSWSEGTNPFNSAGRTIIAMEHNIGKTAEGFVSITIDFKVAAAETEIIPYVQLTQVDDSDVDDGVYDGDDTSGVYLTDLKFSAINGTVLDEYIMSPTGDTTSAIIQLVNTAPINVEGKLFAIVDLDTPPTLWRVVQKVTKAPHQYEIAAVRYHADKYAKVESGWAIDADDYSLPASQSVPPPTSLVVTEYLTQVGAQIKSAILIGWIAPRGKGSVTAYEIQVKCDDDIDWRSYGLMKQTSFDVFDLPVGACSVRVRSVNIINVPSAWVQSDLTLLGMSLTPANIENFRVTVVNDNVVLSWDAASELNVQKYEIRFSPLLTGATWDAATVIQSVVGLTSIQVSALSGTYMIKAVTYSGAYSASAEQVTTEIPSLLRANIVDELTAAPVWDGTLTGVVVDSDRLRLDVDGDGNFVSGGVYISEIMDLGARYVSRVTPKMSAAGNNVGNVIANWVTLAGVTAMSGVSIGDWGVGFDMRLSDDDGSTWGDWFPAVVGDYSFRSIQFRLTLNTNSISLTPDIAEAELLVDMPDRVEGENDVAISTGGSTIVFDPPFHTLSGLAVNMQGLLTTDYYVITDKSVSGFKIQCFDATDSAISRGVFDYVAKGYGKSLT